jgi:CheY-like chemotaxis protein
LATPGWARHKKKLVVGQRLAGWLATAAKTVAQTGSRASTPPTPSAKRLDLELLPDVVVLDLLLPRAPEGMRVLRELRARDRPVVAISRMGELGPQAMVAGAHAFLEKHGRDVDDLLDMIRAAHRHDPWPRGG